jgi:hypothetical protein
MATTADSPAAPLKTYTGSCTCAAFTYTVQLPELTSVNECNCSICTRKGCKWIFPGADCFTVTKDSGTLKDYEFGGKAMAHKVHEIQDPRWSLDLRTREKGDPRLT